MSLKHDDQNKKSGEPHRALETLPFKKKAELGQWVGRKPRRMWLEI